jgi:hypothetical protein
VILHTKHTGGGGGGGGGRVLDVSAHGQARSTGYGRPEPISARPVEHGLAPPSARPRAALDAPSAASESWTSATSATFSLITAGASRAQAAVVRGHPAREPGVRHGAAGLPHPGGHPGEGRPGLEGCGRKQSTIEI